MTNDKIKEELVDKVKQTQQSAEDCSLLTGRLLVNNMQNIYDEFIKNNIDSKTKDELTFNMQYASGTFFNNCVCKEKRKYR